MVTVIASIAFSLFALWWLRATLPRLDLPRVLIGVGLGLAIPLGVLTFTSGTTALDGRHVPAAASPDPWLVAAAGR